MPFTNQPYYVVFSDLHPRGWRWRLLKKGFRHCFLLIPTPKGLIYFDPLATGWVIRIAPPVTPAILEEALRLKGFCFAKTLPKRTKNSLPTLTTCVSSIKRFIGIGGLLPLTPYGLYRTLLK